MSPTTTDGGPMDEHEQRYRELMRRAGSPVSRLPRPQRPVRPANPQPPQPAAAASEVATAALAAAAPMAHAPMGVAVAGTGEPWSGREPTVAVAPWPADLVDAVWATIVDVVAGLAARIPTTPAAVLGRPASERGRTMDGRFGGDVADATAGIDQHTADRLLGALELAVDELMVDVPTGLVEHLALGPYPETFATVTESGESELRTALRLLGQLAPTVRPALRDLLEALAERFDAPLDGDGEAEVAAAHGRTHLAPAVAAAAVVLRAAQVPLVGAGASAVVALALDAAVHVLARRPVPPEYVAARRALRRAQYLLPRWTHGTAEIDQHRFALAEGPVPPEIGEPANGLVQAVRGGIVVRTGRADGVVDVALQVLDGAPDEVATTSWDEVVELSYDAVDGFASVQGRHATGHPNLAEQTPPSPGPMRARVHVVGRDGPAERYEIVVWSAPSAPEIVHRAADTLGHRLRGEPDPEEPVRPQTGYEWVEHGALGVAATVTVVTGSSAEQVLTAFGADPTEPAAFAELAEQDGIDPWVAVLPVEGAVLAVEYNGYQGAQRPVLRGLSALGRAASSYWNVNALRTLSFARDGHVLASFEPGMGSAADDDEVRAALTGLDLDDYRDLTATTLVAVARFAGYAITEADLARIEAAGVAYRILPQLPELYAEERLPDGSRRWPGGLLGEDTERLCTWTDEALRDLAWWVARDIAEHAGAIELPGVRASLAARTLTEQAQRAARASLLQSGTQHHVWTTLHAATNPDALAAATHSIDGARWAAGPDAAAFLDRVRARVLG